MINPVSRPSAAYVISLYKLHHGGLNEKRIGEDTLARQLADAKHQAVEVTISDEAKRLNRNMKEGSRIE